MNAFISYDWLKEYVDLRDVTPEEFARRMSLSGPAVEKIIPQASDLENIVVGRIKEIRPHPNADKLRLAMTDIGGKTVTIVCGGVNLGQDQWVTVALAGARVRWHGEGDLVTLEPTEIRGVRSEGMICAANEIGLADAFPHAEREILDLGGSIPEEKWKAGALLADALGFTNDVVLDTEVTSNRVDAMGMVGMAREAAAILNVPFTWKSLRLPKVSKKIATPLRVKVRTKELCPRYMAARIEGVNVGPSPWWLKRRLRSAGIRSINNLVDITNFVMLELAQPLHVFDAERVKGDIEVRLARAGERLMALDGKEYALEDTMLVIADEHAPVAIAGVMGGEVSGVKFETTSIILESATFDPVSVRRTSRALHLQSDAQLRFEKALSVEAPPFALARAVELIRDLAGGTLVEIVDVTSMKSKPKTYALDLDEAAALIGVAIPKKDMMAMLRRLGFELKAMGNSIRATVPWWRDHDIESGRDLVEEIARLHGYANILPVIPFGLAPRPVDPELVWEERIRDLVKGAGYTETYSYSFVSPELLAKAGYDSTGLLHLQNPLAADLAIMRTSLLPSLLQVASENRERTAEQRLFEVANVYYPSSIGQLPEERLELGALVMTDDENWKHAKGLIEILLHEMGIHQVGWRRLSSDSFWHPGRTIQAFVDGRLVATAGEVSPRIAERFKLEGRPAMVHIPLKELISRATLKKTYVPFPVFPTAKRDISIVVLQGVEYDDVARTILRVDPLVTRVEWFDTYRGPRLGADKKAIAVHLEFSAPDRTLESAEVDALMEKITLALRQNFEAEIRS